MRKVEEWNGHTIAYPDELCFAFNPCIVKIEGNEQDTFTMGVSVDWGDEQQQLQYKAYSGAAIADISAYVQAAFRRKGVVQEIDYDAGEAQKSNKGMSLTLSVSVSGVDEEFTFSTFVIWGSLQYGGKDVYNAPKTLDCFRGYPFSVGIYIAEPTEVKVMDGGQQVGFYTFSNEEIWEMPLETKTFKSDIVVVRDNSLRTVETTFEYLFGETFSKRYATQAERAILRVHDGCTDGIYLRWIDAHGFLRYYLFKKGGEAITTASTEYLRDDLRQWDDVVGYGYEAGRNQVYNRKKSYTLCAPLVDKDTWNLLSGLVTSPRIDMWMGEVDGVHRWMSVNAQAGTYNKSNDELEDFVINIDLPTQQLQGI